MGEQMNKTYKVVHVDTGREIQGAFVLLPEHDSSARIALAAYGEATHKPKLSQWIKHRLQEIHIKRKNRNAGQ